MPKGHCKDCEAAEPKPQAGEGVYTCRLDPPEGGVWPTVHEADWCRQFEPRAAAPRRDQPAREQIPTPHPERITRPESPTVTRGKPGRKPGPKKEAQK